MKATAKDIHDAAYGCLAGALVGDPDESRSLESAFVEDQIDLLAGRLTVTAGTKVEHTQGTGLDLQPSLRALARLSPRQVASSASRCHDSTPAPGPNSACISAARCRQASDSSHRPWSSRDSPSRHQANASARRARRAVANSSVRRA